MELHLTNEQLKAYARGPEPVPEGVYQVEICQIDERPTKTGGVYLHITERIATGEYAGRYVWHNVNVVCPTSDLAEDIAKQEISIMAIAAGLSEMRNTNELIGKTVTVRVTHQTWMDQTRVDVKAVQSDGAPY